MNKQIIEQYQNFAEKSLGFRFDDPMLIVTALTHRSYVNEHKKSTKEHNERLEFLGDAVLELVTSDFLYQNYSEPEGIMTSWRAALVRTESICAAGKELGYEPLVRLSKGEQHGSARAHDVILADCFEAVIGAVYLDKGYEEAKKIIEQHILCKIDEILEEGSWRDPKSYFQELAQHFEGATPSYHTIQEEGPDHDKLFTVGAYVNDEVKGIGVGHSKQEAQTIAAREGIKLLKSLHGYVPFTKRKKKSKIK